MEISGFGLVLLFISGGLAFIIITLFAGSLLRPKNPTPEKQIIYESGEEPAGTAWGQFNIRFYVVALIFLLFEAELVFLFPWATVFADESLVAETDGLWAIFSTVETFIFITILLVGLVYVWSKGMLDWIKPKPKQVNFESSIPSHLYDRINEKYG